MRRSLLFAVFILWVLAGHGQTTLEYHLKKGDVFTVKQTAEQIISQDLDGAEHVITNLIDGILEFKVLGEVPKGYELALTFKDLNLSISSNLQGELMNVKAREIIEGDSQSAIFNTILDNPVTLILAKTGDIIRVDGGDSLVNKMAQASGLEDDFSINMMKKSLEKEFGSEALSNSYKQMTFFYPDKKVKVNDQWENTYTGKLKAENQWTLKSLSNTQAAISGTAVITIDIQDANTTMVLKGSQNTMIQTDSPTGFIQEMTIEGICTGSSTLVQLGDQKLPTSIKSKISYKLINTQHVQQKL